MHLLEFFKGGLRHQSYLHTHWIISLLAVCEHKPPAQGQTPFAYQVETKDNDSRLWTYDPEQDMALVPIDDTDKNKVLFHVNDIITLEVGDLPNIKQTTNAWVGNILINAVCFCYPFGDLIEFKTKTLSGGKMNDWVVALVREGKISAEQLIKYFDAVSSLGGWCPLGVPSASPKCLVIDPAVLKRRDELLAQYKDQLDDPVVVANIQSELAKLDQATLRDDPSYGFFINFNRSFAVSRMRLKIMYGIETGLGTTRRPPKTILTPLDQGWDMKNMPYYADNCRAASYNRGSETAVGGEWVKIFYRLFQNYRVVEEDCGTKMTMKWVLNSALLPLVVGAYELGSTTPHTNESLTPLLGKTIELRSPMLCKATGENICQYCAGAVLSRSPTGIHIGVAAVGSVIMLESMKAIHGKAAVNAEFDIQQSIL